MAKPVVIRSFLNPSDAHFAKLIIEDTGIPVFLYDENTSGSTVSYTYALGGIKIVVPEQYVSEAIEILDKDFEQASLQNIEEIEDFTCPECGSKQIYRKTGYTSFSEIILFILAGLFFQNKKKTKCKCRNCHYTWRSY